MENVHPHLLVVVLFDFCDDDDDDDDDDDLVHLKTEFLLLPLIDGTS